jgi:peptidoglycan hydrolase-like protein with peptidoglycan-binding domain
LIDGYPLIPLQQFMQHAGPHGRLSDVTARAEEASSVQRRWLTAAATLSALALALSGCSDSSKSAGTVPAPVESVALPEPDVTSESAEPSLSASPSLSPSASPSPTRSRRPVFAYDVVAAQRRLTELKYYVAAIDGRPGSAMRSAVMAFQKVQGLPADGTVGAATLAALKAPKSPKLKASTPSHRVEIDLSKQVMYVVSGGVLQRILPVSSGNGARYRQKSGRYARALTPTGWYKVQRRIVGVREADLGTLYDPQYFYRGWAIHGSNSVPAWPASHGCVRVTRSDAKWLLNAISVGTSVYLYGGVHTFPAGSSAPGTDNPSGDTDPEPTPTPTPKPTPSASTSPSPTPKPSTSPTPTPTPTVLPTPSASKSS